MKALESCFSQTWPEIEIVIGDDSPDDATEQLIASLSEDRRNCILYAHHRPSLGQNGNVNNLFQRARGTRLVLLHDDDVLLPDAIANLAGLWERCPTLDAAFGKQLLIREDDSPVDHAKSEHLNLRYHRVTANSGRQRIPVVAGLQRMFPNDGYLISTALARRVGYRPVEEVGHACDADFGIRFCAVARDVWFFDEFTTKYRISDHAISKTAVTTPYVYEILSNLKVPSEAQPILDAARREITPSAVSGFTRLGNPQRAWELFLSTDYPMRRRLTPRGFYHLIRIARAFLR